MTEYQHGGDIYTQEVELDYSANINPLGLPESVKQAVIDSLETCSVYPDSRSGKLVRELSLFHRIPEEWLICGNGAADLIFQTVLAGQYKKAVLMAPTFAEYEQALKTVNCEITYYNVPGENQFIPDVEALLEVLDRGCDVLFLCNPNNPTGIPMKQAEMERVLARCAKQNIMAVVDECFCDFLDDPSLHSVLDRVGVYPNLIIIKAFTKLYAMAGIRLGYGISSNRVLLDSIESVRQPWSVSAMAQAAGIAALKETGYVDRARAIVREERRYLMEELKKAGFIVYPSAANYIFFSWPQQSKDRDLAALCLKQKILIRSCGNYRGLDASFYRICVKMHPENQRLMEVLRQTAAGTSFDIKKWTASE